MLLANTQTRSDVPVEVTQYKPLTDELVSCLILVSVNDIPFFSEKVKIIINLFVSNSFLQLLNDCVN